MEQQQTAIAREVGSQCEENRTQRFLEQDSFCHHWLQFIRTRDELNL